jgi:putative addiction module CopG family antidote
MQVNLTLELELLLTREVESGRYASVDDVLQTALHLLAQHNERLATQKAEFNKKIADGLASINREDYIDGESFFRQLELEELALLNRPE